MGFDFYKYQGTGNDFVMIDNRSAVVDRTDFNLFKRMCDRRFGIGADGVILIQSHPVHAFEMVYLNADGREGSMCGNGGRCAVRFAEQLQMLTGDEVVFLAVDGLHKACVEKHLVSLQMIDADLPISAGQDGWFLNTGSPHHCVYVEDLENFPVEEEGMRLRWDERYAPGGTNVNFIQKLGADRLRVRTYERGVEAETYSCGTGVTAAALLLAYLESTKQSRTIAIETMGGELAVRFENSPTGFTHIFLIGPAEKVFEGKFS